METTNYSQKTSMILESFEKVSLLYAAASRYNANWHSNLHAHYCAELFLVTEGKGQLKIENQIYPICTNDLIIINPHVQHTELSDLENPLSYIVIGLENVELTSSNEDEEIRFHILNLKDTKDIFRFYFSQLLDEYQQTSQDSEQLCQNIIENLLILLGRQVSLTTALAPIKRKSALLCIDIRQYIDNHFRENLTLDILAERAHVSKYHMVHIFTEEYGISPINYLIIRRIKEGQKLLKTTDHSLALISRTLGFSSPSYFSQVFKKHMQCSPLEYRKKSRN